MIVSNGKKIILLFSVLLLLVGYGCSGDGVSIHSPTGIWIGELTDPEGIVHPVQIFITPDSNFYLRFPWGDDYIIAEGFEVTDNYGSDYTTDIYKRYEEGNLYDVIDSTLYFVVNSPYRIIGTIQEHLSKNEWVFTAVYDSNSVSTVVLADIDEGWRFDDVDEVVDLVFDESGEISGVFEGDCVVDSGQISQMSEDLNLFSMQMTMTCGYNALSGIYSGVASYAIDEFGEEILYYFIENRQRKYPLSGELTRTTPLPPVANAGEDFSTPLDHPATVDGTASSDPNGTPLTYFWTIVDAPPDAFKQSFDNPELSTSSFTPTVAGDYLIELTVSDGLFTAVDMLTVTARPNRFLDQGDGTVLDTYHDLIWLKQADCFTSYLHWSADYDYIEPGTLVEDGALELVAALTDGFCGLTDGSLPGDWRLPTIDEWNELVSIEYYDPALSNIRDIGQWAEGDAFTGVRTDFPYWASTEDETNIDNRWYVELLDGTSETMFAGNKNYIWPVRTAPVP